MKSDRFTISEEVVTDDEWSSGEWARDLDWFSREICRTGWEPSDDGSERWSVVTDGKGGISVVVDGRTYPGDNGVESLSFSPDGRRFALVTYSQHGECRAHRVYVDGVQSGPPVQCYGPPPSEEEIFEHWGFFECDGGPPDEVDNEGWVADPRLPAPIFSADSRRVAWLSHGDLGHDTMMVVVDGRVGPISRKIRNLHFTGDGRAVWEAVVESGATVVVVDFKESEEWDTVHETQEFSNGEIAFWGCREGKHWFVSGHKKLGPFDEYRRDDPEGEAGAAIALRGVWRERSRGQWGCTVGPNEQGEEEYLESGERESYDRFTERVEREVFRPWHDEPSGLCCEEYRWAVGGMEPGGQWFVLADGEVRGPYDGIGWRTLCVGPDGTIAFSASRDKTYSLVFGPVEIAGYDWIAECWTYDDPLMSDHIFCWGQTGGGFLRDGSLVFCAQRGGQRLRVTVSMGPQT